MYSKINEIQDMNKHFNKLQSRQIALVFQANF